MSKRFTLQLRLACVLFAVLSIGFTSTVVAQSILGRTASSQKVDVQEAFRNLFNEVNVTYAISPNVHGQVTVDDRVLTFENKFNGLLKQVDATYRVEGGVYEIIRKDEVGKVLLVLEPQAPSRRQRPELTSPQNRYEFNQVDVRIALREVFKQSHQSYTIDPAVQGVVTLSLMNVSFDVALENIVRQVDATYRIDGGVYMIFPRPGSRPAIRRDERIDFASDSSDITISSKNEAPATMVQDSRFLYVLIGSRLEKIQKSDMKIVQVISLNPTGIGNRY